MITDRTGRWADYTPVTVDIREQSAAPRRENETLQSANDVPDPTANSNHSRPSVHRQERMGDTQRCLTLIGIGVGVVAMLIVVILPMSFVGVEYSQLGFKRRRTTGTVDTSKVYQTGRHLIGPDYEFKVFPADAQVEIFTRQRVFNADRLEVTISATMIYFLRPHQLRYLHANFDLHYAPVLRKNARDAIKGTATLFSNREYISERQKIEDALFKAVKERLGGRCCELNCWKVGQGPCTPGCKQYDSCTESDWGLFAEVRYFQLHELGIPRELNERYLQALVLQEENQKELLFQTGTIIRKETDQLVKQTENAALEISQNATAQSNLLQAKARATAKAIVEKARSDGLKYLYNELAITSNEHRAAFDYLRTMRKQDRVKLAIDYQQYMSGPMK